jgi:23S rRNA pseudouridine2604 synthase
MCEFLDYRVIKLKRIRIMDVELGDLRVGEWRDLTQKELDSINNSVVDSTKNYYD